jgi:transcriptional regulator with PAS, ATPase and Fis domain
MPRSAEGLSKTHLDETPRKTTNAGGQTFVFNYEEAILGIKASKHQSHQIQQVSRKLEQSVKNLEQIVADLDRRVILQDEFIRQTVKSATLNYLEKYKVDKVEAED